MLLTQKPAKSAPGSPAEDKNVYDNNDGQDYHFGFKGGLSREQFAAMLAARTQQDEDRRAAEGKVNKGRGEMKWRREKAVGSLSAPDGRPIWRFKGGEKPVRCAGSSPRPLLSRPRCRTLFLASDHRNLTTPPLPSQMPGSTVTFQWNRAHNSLSNAKDVR